MEFTLQVTLAFPEGCTESPADIKSEIHAAIVAWAQCCAYVPVVTVSDDHSESVIGELTRALGNCIGLINALRAETKKKGESSIVKSALAALCKYAPPVEESK